MLFSIIIPFYNIKKNIFYETLFSIFNQRNCNFEFEIIIIDNGSKEALKIDDISLKFKEKIKIIRIEKNITIGPARNIGIKNSKGNWIFFLDGDDILEINFFETIKKVIKENEGCEQIKFKSRTFSDNIEQNRMLNSNPEYTKKNDFSTFKNITVWTSIYKKEFLFKNELFFLNFERNFEDLYFSFITIIFSERNNSLVLINNCLINYRKSEFQTMYKFSKETKKNRISLEKEAKTNIFLAILFLEKKLGTKKIFLSEILAYMISIWTPRTISPFFYYINKQIYKKIKYYCKKISKSCIPFLNRMLLRIFKFRLLTFISIRLYLFLTRNKEIKNN